MAIDKELQKTLTAIEKYDESGNGIKVMNIVANLVYEAINTRKTIAKYDREFKFSNLKITIKYGDGV